jgi:hypothetical protein
MFNLKNIQILKKRYSKKLFFRKNYIKKDKKMKLPDLKTDSKNSSF